MSTVVVSGLINVETTLRVEGFPIHYSPVRYPFGGVNSTVSGVGYNITKALRTLGDEVRCVSIIGEDWLGQLVLDVLEMEGLSSKFIRRQMDETAQSVILYDGDGRRQINVDLKQVQEQVYPLERFEVALEGADLAVLSNINFSRPWLDLVKARRIPIATDVHAISSLDDDYNRAFMAAADILFMSNDFLPVAPEEWARQVLERYSPQVVVIGLGAEGALLAVRGDGEVERVPPVRTREIINTVGAGDALFSAFVHFYIQTFNPYISLQKAMVFASYKIGERGAAEGFLTEDELDAWYEELRFT
ncbi:MAG: carbohydrate kinase family protein [Anaerolineales bacterium]